MTRIRPAVSGLAVLAVALAGAPAGATPAQGPKVRELRTQRVGQTTYFHVRFEPPADYRAPQLTRTTAWWQDRGPELALLPRLVPQDTATRDVYLRVTFPQLAQQEKLPDGPLVSEPAVEGLEFAGKVEGKGPAQFLLLYPIGMDDTAAAKGGKESELVKLLRQRGRWAQVAVTLDFGAATRVKSPEGGVNRQAKSWPEGHDLEGLWAAAQAARFAVLDAQAPDFGFYSFAREATGRKYGVPAPAIRPPWQPSASGPGLEPAPAGGRGLVSRRLYELTTGADAIAESMALNRLRTRDFRDKLERTVDIAKIPGVDIAEHPWAKMMAGKKAAPEPLARLVPHDNYYVHFKSIVKLLDASDLMEQWGTTLTRAFEVNSRDYRLQERLHEQLCLKDTGLARLFGPAVIKGVAITGSDPYVREGSDVTVLFHLANKSLFRGAVDGFLEEARKRHGADLQESQSEQEKVTVESYVTPRREVSLHRAFFEDYAVYSNSLAAVRRVLEAYRGKRKALADALDFQYMRTVFGVNDPKEDGFVFLSDAFLRNLVGPTLRVKERRRLEGLTSLYMATHGALFAAWETGKLPVGQDALLAEAGLKADELFSPEGPAVFWDAQRKQAFSPFYNTIQFATPLIEIPIDRVTAEEEREYRQFRAQYMGLWRQYFDPVGLRIGLAGRQARVELYILPLVQNTQYNELRRLTGDGTIPLDPTQFSAKTLAQFVGHLSPKARERTDVGQVLRTFARDIPGLNWLGDWFVVRLDDSPVYEKLAELAVRQELDPDRRTNWDEVAALAFQVPLTVGVEVKNKLVFAGVLAAARKAVLDALPDGIDWEPMKPAYNGVTIVRIQAKGDLVRDVTGEQARKDFTPSLYYALIDNAWYLSLSDGPLKELIDRRAARRKEPGQSTKGQAVQVNTSLYVAPEAAVKAKGFLRFYLEWESHRRALANTLLLYPLYRGALVAPGAPAEKVQQAALHYLGFVPVSPDLAPFTYERKTEEVVNKRHGSLRQPRLHGGVAPNSPPGQLLEEFRTIRADLRFREDGINTVITFERKTAK